MRRTILATAFALLLISAVPATAAETRTISVTGSSSAELKNDTATFTVAVGTRDRDQSEALNENSARTRAVIDALEAAGVLRDQIETLGISVRRREIKHGPDREPARVYVVTNRLRVTTDEAARAGELIGIAIDAGATGVGRLAFTRSDAREQYREELGDAFTDARDKAARLAEEAGMTLGSPISIEESSFRRSTTSTEYSGSALDTGGRAEPAPVRPGKTRIRVKVFVVFEMS